MKNKKMASLPLIIYILWPQWFRIRKKCHSTRSHLSINSGMGRNETLYQFMGGPHLVLSRPPRKGKWGIYKNSEERHSGFNQFLKIILNIVPKNISYCPKIDIEIKKYRKFLQQSLKLKTAVFIKLFQSSSSIQSDNLNT